MLFPAIHLNFACITIDFSIEIVCIEIGDFIGFSKINRNFIKYLKWRLPMAKQKSEFGFLDCYNFLILHQILIWLVADNMV